MKMDKRGEKINIIERKWRLEQFHVDRKKKTNSIPEGALDPVLLLRETPLDEFTSTSFSRFVKSRALRSTEAIALILSDADQT